MILRYVSRVLVCKLHPSRAVRYFQRDVFNNKSTLSRPLSFSLSPLVVALHFRFCFFLFRNISLFFSLSLSLFRSRRRRGKSFSQRRRKCVAPTQPADYIVKYTQRRNYAAVDLCVGCLLRTAFYGCLIKLRSNYRRIIKKLSRPLSAPRVVKARRIVMIRSYACVYRSTSYTKIHTHTS